MKDELLSIFNNKKTETEVLNPESYSGSISYIENFLLPIIESGFSNFVNNNKSAIKTFLYWQDKIEEIKYRNKPHFTLTMVKNRNSTPSIIAKVKWKYKFKGKYKKSPYLSVYIASSSKYPKGLKDSQLFYDAPKKIQEYLIKECPIEFDY
jgi:hypothetical protein